MIFEHNRCERKGGPFSRRLALAHSPEAIRAVPASCRSLRQKGNRTSPHARPVVSGCPKGHPNDLLGPSVALATETEPAASKPPAGASDLHNSQIGRKKGRLFRAAQGRAARERRPRAPCEAWGWPERGGADEGSARGSGLGGGQGGPRTKVSDFVQKSRTVT
jgi:hypothetical protein